DEDGHVRGMLATVIETTGKVVAERRTKLLNRELSHRGRNMLSVVSAIARQTLNSGQFQDEPAQTLLRRINALASTQEILTGPMYDRGSLRDIIEATLAPYRNTHNAFFVEGPRCELSSRQALSLALAINEL